MAKEAKSGQILVGVPVHVQGNRGVPVHPTSGKGVPVHVQGCTDTPHQKATCTGIGPGCTGTCEPKMPRMLCFCVIKPEFIHR